MHTQGPWYRNIKPAKKYNTIFAGTAPNHTHVCHLTTMGMSDVEIEGNCDLITATPDLLAACEAIDAELRHGQNVPSLRAMELVRNALTKAKGASKPYTCTLCGYGTDSWSDMTSHRVVSCSV